MSVTAPPFPPGDHLLPEPEPVTPPWKRVVWVVGGLVGAVAVILLLSGRTITWHRAAAPEPARATQSPVANPLERAYQPPAAAALPAASKPAAKPTETSDTRAQALAAGIATYSVRESTAQAARAATKGDTVGEDGLPVANRGDALEASLKASEIEGVRVSQMPNPTWTIAAGRVLPCTTATLLDSTLPGGVTVTILEAIRSDTGDFIPLPAGSTVTGIVQRGLVNGLDRIGVLMTKLRTAVMFDRHGSAHRFTIDLNSPGAGPLGETGWDGDVDRHWGKKIGGLIGIAFIQTAMQSVTAYAQNGGGSNRNNSPSFNFYPAQSGGESAANELLRSWINIPDIIRKLEGQRCSIYLVRDLDFHGAYRILRLS